MKEKTFKSILWVLIGVVFFGCSKVDRYGETEINSDYNMDIFSNKDSLSKVISIYFSKKGKYLYLRNSEGRFETFDIENANLIQKKQEEDKVADSSIISSHTLYSNKNINLSITEKLIFSERKYQMEHSLGVGISGDNVSSGKVDIKRFSKNKVPRNVDKQFKEKLTSINIKKKIKASINIDGTVSLYSTVTNKNLLTITLFKNTGSWLAITPKGYYNGSLDAFIYFDVLQFYQKFYRPEIVKLALQGKTIPNLPKMSDIKAPPKVKIFKKETEINAQSIRIDVKITPQSGGVGKIKVMNNGTAVSMETRAFGKSSTGKPFTKSYTVKLLKGENNISVSAFEETNSQEGEASVYSVTSTYSQPYKAKIHAIVLGVQEFSNSDFNLNNTRADAKIFTDVLEKQRSNGLFDGGNIVHLKTKEEKSKTNILKEFEKMRSIHPEDVFVFYVGSHGEVRDGVYYLIPSNMEDDSTQSLKKDALSADELAEAIAKIQTHQKMIILDTCYAGKAGGKIKAKLIEENKGMTPKTATNILSNTLKTMVFSAATSFEEANENYKGHGIFTYFVVKGLEGKANTNNNSSITTLELMTYVTNNVHEESDKVLNHKQNPVINYDGQVFDVARVE